MMSEAWQEADSDRLLRQGLGELPVPVPSSDFDSRIHAALGQTPPWWKLLWATVRPACAAAACSLVVTLALLQGMSSQSVPAFGASASAAGNMAEDRNEGHRNILNRNILNRDIEQMDLSNASLIGLLPLRQTVPPPQSAPNPAPAPEHSSYQRNHRAAHPAA